MACDDVEVEKVGGTEVEKVGGTEVGCSGRQMKRIRVVRDKATKHNRRRSGKIEVKSILGCEGRGFSKMQKQEAKNKLRF